MTSSLPTLHMLCGKIAAGKSTLAAKLAEADATVLISEDKWLGTLFGDQMTTAADYVRHSAKLRHVMGPHAASVLNAGASVVLDFPANTVEFRKWMHSIIERANAGHVLHVLTPPDQVCLERLHARNAGGDHPFEATEAQFHQFSQYFELPTPEEGFNLKFYHESI